MDNGIGKVAGQDNEVGIHATGGAEKKPYENGFVPHLTGSDGTIPTKKTRPGKLDSQHSVAMNMDMAEHGSEVSIPSFGLWLKRLRGVETLEAFSERTGIPKSTVSRWESGKVNPTNKSLACLASAAGIELEALAAMVQRAEAMEQKRSAQPAVQKQFSLVDKICVSVCESIGMSADETHSAMAAHPETFDDFRQCLRAFVRTLLDHPSGK